MPMWSYYRPPLFYTQSARRLVCSPKGNNCQNKQNIVIFSSCKIRSQQVFRGREEKSQQRGNTLPYPLVCKETDIKLTKNILIFQKIFILVQINGFQTRAFVLCLPFVDPLCETGNSSPGCLCLTTGFAFN